MGSGKNKRVVRRKRKRKINKKKLLLLVIVVVLFVFGIFKLTQGAILAIQNIIPKSAKQPNNSINVKPFLFIIPHLNM